MPGSGQQQWRQARLEFYAWLIVFGICTLVVGVWWLGWGRRGERLLPARRVRTVPWSFFEVALTALLLLLVWGVALDTLLIVGYLLLQVTGMLGWLTGVQGPTPSPSSATTAIPRSVMEELALWGETLAIPFKVATVPFVLNRLSGARSPISWG